MAERGRRFRMIPQYQAITLIADARDKASTPRPIQALVTQEERAISLNPPMLQLRGFPIFKSCDSDADPLIDWKYRFMISALPDEMTIDQSLIVWMNVYLKINPGDKVFVIDALQKMGYAIDEDMTVPEWAGGEGSPFSDIDFADTSNYDNLTPNHVYSLGGITYALIGRQLTSLNYDAWMNRRLTAFANACGADPDTHAYLDLKPGLAFCSKLHPALQSKHMLRRHCFMSIYNQGQRAISHTWKNAARTALVYLSGAEMANFILIHEFIVIKNPILLAWNELAKELPLLIAATRKFVELGEYGPYTKLVFPPDDTTEFNRRALKSFSEVAVGIANMTETSLQNYRGGGQGDASALVKQAKMIVLAYNGSVTHTTNAITQAILTEDDNQLIRAEIRKGAELTMEERDDPTTNPPITVQQLS